MRWLYRVLAHQTVSFQASLLKRIAIAEQEEMRWRKVGETEKTPLSILPDWVAEAGAWKAKRDRLEQKLKRLQRREDRYLSRIQGSKARLPAAP